MSAAAAGRFAFGALLCLLAAGCAGPPILTNHLAVQAPSDGASAVAGGFDRGWYRTDGAGSATLVLADGPAESAERATVIQMFWQPWPGSTAVKPTATNAVVHHVLFAQGGGAVYTGAGFVYPHQEVGSSPLRITLAKTELRLQQASGGLETPPERVTASGRIDIELSTEKATSALERIHERLDKRFDDPPAIPRP